VGLVMIFIPAVRLRGAAPPAAGFGSGAGSLSCTHDTEHIRRKEHLMKKSILLILIGKRNEAAVNVQKILTAWGCIIKTRLGIHDGVLDNCSDEGLLILELYGTDEQKEELARKVAVIPGVESKLVELSLPA
jgi:hypothetical protein